MNPSINIATSKETVDPRGIEPLSHPCHGYILPVYYGPLREQILFYHTFQGTIFLTAYIYLPDSHTLLDIPRDHQM